MTATAQKLLVIGHSWPEPTATAAGVRMMQLLEVFKLNGYAITFACSAALLEAALRLEEMGIRTQSITLNSNTFNEFVGSLAPTVVLFDRFLTEEQFGWRVAESCPQALRILDTEDLHSLRLARQEVVKKNLPFHTDIWLAMDKTKREIASILRCDLSLIISKAEMQFLKEGPKVKEELLLYLPFFLDPSLENNSPGYHERAHFMFLGGGKHAPNLDAITQLKKYLWPRIREELPMAQLHIYGAYLPQYILEYHSPGQGIYTRGWAKEVGEVMQKARVCLAPLRFGAGLKGKLLHSMYYGTPSVTTPIGAEGMHGHLPWNGAVANNDNDFVTSAVRLYNNAEKWREAQHNGFRLLEENYAKTFWEPHLMAHINQLLINLEKHRSRNFMGQLLQHQTLQATKYLSKWIEAKERAKGK